MFKKIDDFLNNITMYKLLLYGLEILAGITLIMSIFGLVSFDLIKLISNLILLISACYLANLLLSKIFKAVVNNESYLITALILYFILAPSNNFKDALITFVAGVIAMLSKYILAIRKKHIFNPAGIAVFILGILGLGNAIWWVGALNLLPFVFVLGFLIVRKTRRIDMVLVFTATSVVTLLIFNTRNNILWTDTINQIFTSWPLIFFATIMLTEPLTLPPTRVLRNIYAVITGILFGAQFSVGPIFSTPELALIVGNAFAYIVSPKYKLMLTLREKIKINRDTYDFVFESDSKINFTPGQYMEFTLGHDNPDARGNRRYFSLASSPTETEIRLGIKFGEPSSSFKSNLLNLTPNQKIAASQLIGDFTLPKDKNKKLVFIAGGIGITPFRSILKYLVDTNQKRDIALIYSARTKDEFVYGDILREAGSKLGVKTFYIDTETQGRMDSERLKRDIPDFKERYFYISGSHGVVFSFEEMLKTLQVVKKQIVTDYFPGFT